MKALLRMAIACLVPVFVCCNKETVIREDLDSDKTDENLKTGMSKEWVLKEMIHEDSYNLPRHYVFYYNHRRSVDSIQVSGNANYTYKVYYKGSKIDSVTLVQNGVIQSVNTNFQYKGNTISYYDYYCRICGQQTPNTYLFNYDHKKKIISIEKDGNPYMQLTYDNYNNVIQWNSTSQSTFTYDNQPNPLYYVNNLFALFVEEPFIWYYAFSQHNSTSRSYAGGTTIFYQNEYNTSGQLVTKSFNDPQENGQNTYSFLYN